MEAAPVRRCSPAWDGMDDVRRGDRSTDWMSVMSIFPGPAQVPVGSVPASRLLMTTGSPVGLVILIWPYHVEHAQPSELAPPGSPVLMICPKSWMRLRT